MGTEMLLIYLEELILEWQPLISECGLFAAAPAVGHLMDSGLSECIFRLKYKLYFDII